MPSEITVVSNLTHAAFGSTVTSATTSDVIDDTSSTKRHRLFVQSVGTSLEAVEMGDINLGFTSRAYWVRLRNLSAAQQSPPFITVAVSHSGGDVEFATMQAGETFGPVRMVGLTASHPVLKVKASVTDTPVEVILCEVAGA